MAFDLSGFVRNLEGVLAGHPDHPHTIRAQELVAKGATLVAGISPAALPTSAQHAGQVDLLQSALSLVLAATPVGPYVPLIKAVLPLIQSEQPAVAGGN